MVTINVSSLNEIGKYLMVRGSDIFADVFLCRISSPVRLPLGAVDLGGGQCIVGFSRKCTHMSCHLVRDVAPDSSGDMLTRDGLISCRCHLSMFDLANNGLTVIGPATDELPSVELRPVDHPVTQVEIVRWQRGRSAPYGVPFGGTSQNPGESEHA